MDFLVGAEIWNSGLGCSVAEVTKVVSHLCIGLEYMELRYRMLQLSCREESELCV